MTLIMVLGPDIIKVHPHTKFRLRMSNGSALRALTDAQTDRQTDGTNSIMSTDDAGGNENTWALAFPISKCTIRLRLHVGQYLLHQELVGGVGAAEAM